MIGVFNYIAEGGWPLRLQLGVLLLGLLSSIALLVVEWRNREDRHRRWKVIAASVAMITPVVLMISATIVSHEDEAKSKKRDREFQDLLGSVTGGDTICVLAPFLPFISSNSLTFSIQLRGKHPLYDLKL